MTEHPIYDAIASAHMLGQIDWEAVLADHRREQDAEYWGEDR